MPDYIVGFMPEDFVPPEFKLIQSTSKGYKPEDTGKFVHSQTGEITSTIEAVVLKIQQARTFWGREQLSDEPPQCSSDNAASFKSREGADCKQCPHRCDTPWSVTATERRTKCLKAFVVLAVRNGEPFLIRAHGISAMTMRELATLFVSPKMGQEPFRAKVLISSMEKITEAGKAYQIKTSLLEMLKPEDVETHRALAASLATVQLAAVEDKPALQIATEPAPAVAEPDVFMFDENGVALQQEQCIEIEGQWQLRPDLEVVNGKVVTKRIVVTPPPAPVTKPITKPVAMPPVAPPALTKPVAPVVKPPATVKVAKEPNQNLDDWHKEEPPPDVASFNL